MMMELDFPIGLIADMMASYVLALTDLSSSSSIILEKVFFIQLILGQ